MRRVGAKECVRQRRNRSEFGVESEVGKKKHKKIRLTGLYDERERKEQIQVLK